MDAGTKKKQKIRSQITTYAWDDFLNTALYKGCAQSGKIPQAIHMHGKTREGQIPKKIRTGGTGW